jgi:hypothetical protein
MREIIDEYDIGNAEAFIQFDTGGPVGGYHLVGVPSKENRDDIHAQYDPDQDGWIINRWFFFDEFNEHYARNFTEKIATDDEYREKSLNGETEWKRVNEPYNNFARQVFDEFEQRGLTAYASGDGKRRYETAKSEWERICEELYDGINDRVRNSGEPTEETIGTFGQDKVSEAKGVAESIAIQEREGTHNNTQENDQ